MKMFEEAS